MNVERRGPVSEDQGAQGRIVGKGKKLEQSIMINKYIHENVTMKPSAVYD